MTTALDSTHRGADLRAPRARRTVAVCALALLVVGALADAYAVAHHLPYGFGGHGDPATVGHDWVAHGTALGPPLAPFVALVVATPVALLRRWWGVAAELLLCLVALAVFVGTVGEPSARTVFTRGSFDLAQALVRVLSVAAAAGLLVSAAVDLRGRWAHRRR